jgi:hypothetical protein
VDAFEPRTRELLQAYPAMPATVIAERVGWQRGLTVLKDRVRETFPLTQRVAADRHTSRSIVAPVRYDGPNERPPALAMVLQAT